MLTLKDSLKDKAKLLLTYEGLVGRYQDSLKVEADFISDSIAVDFRANPREFTITVRDTVEIQIGDSFFEDLLEASGGAAVGYFLATITRGN